jgi:hypothetical protein
MTRSRANRVMLKMVRNRSRLGMPRSPISRNQWIERYMEKYIFQNPRFRSHIEITSYRMDLPYEKVEWIVRTFLVRLTYWSIIRIDGYSRFTLPDGLIFHKSFKGKKHEQSSSAANDGKSEHR